MHFLKQRTRRSFLASLGAGAAAAPFIPLLNSHAGGDPFPKRVLLFHTPHGLARSNWIPTGTESDWSLSPILQPLAAFKDRMVVVRGLSNEAAKDGSAQDHGRARMTYRTTRGLNADEQSTSPSIDQVIADEIEAPHNAYASMHSGVRADSRGLSTRGPGEQIRHEFDPVLQHDRLFGDIGEDDAALLRLKANRQRVIDAVRADLDAIQGQVADDDVAKINQHLAGLGALEDKLATLGDLPAGCSVPTPPSGFNAGSDSDYPAIGRAHADVLAAAFACDMTRVASLVYAGGQRVFTWVDGISNVQHDNCHMGNSPNRPLYDDLTSTGIWFAEELARLLTTLDAVPEGDGTLLDNCVIVWGTEMSHGGHDWDDMPVTLFGGAGGALQTDRFMTYDGRALNDLWLSVANLVDVDLATFGDPAFSQGGLPGLA